MSDAKVTLYGADWCIHCSNAKDWLDKKNIAYEFKNVDEPENQNYLMGLKVQGIPFIEVKKEGTEPVHVRGFNPEQLMDAIR